MSTFHCPACAETYQAHWQDPNGTLLCLGCANRQAGRCQFGNCPEHLDQHPCSWGTEQPGSPCRYCNEPVPADGSPCPKCWQPMDIPTFKALFAGEGLDTTLTSNSTDEGAA